MTNKLNSIAIILLGISVILITFTNINLTKRIKVLEKTINNQEEKSKPTEYTKQLTKFRMETGTYYKL